MNPYESLSHSVFLIVRTSSLPYTTSDCGAPNELTEDLGQQLRAPCKKHAALVSGNLSLPHTFKMFVFPLPILICGGKGGLRDIERDGWQRRQRLLKAFLRARRWFFTCLVSLLQEFMPYTFPILIMGNC